MEIVTQTGSLEPVCPFDGVVEEEAIVVKWLGVILLEEFKNPKI